MLIVLPRRFVLMNSPVRHGIVIEAFSPGAFVFAGLLNAVSELSGLN
jgi:hypothetical protein